MVLKRIAVVVAVGLPVVTALPSHYHSCTYNFTGGARLPYKFCNASLPLEERLDDLVQQMTYVEKAQALTTDGVSVPRLGLPLLRSKEDTHGVGSGCGRPLTSNSTGCPTSFPAGIGLGATFNKALWGEVGGVIGLQARALDNQAFTNDGAVPGVPEGPSGLYFLDPNINLARDVRWGRLQEVPGECPYLNSEYAVNLISKTQQGEHDKRFHMAASTAKHWTAYDIEGYIPRVDEGHTSGGYCVNGTNEGCERWNFHMTPPADLFVDYYLSPFKAAVQRIPDGGVQALMCSYNGVYDKPTCANDIMNNKVLRKQWGWDGFIVSDCTALELMQNVKWDNCKHPYPSEGGTCVPQPFPGGHNYTHTVGDTVHAGLVEGGVDMNCGPLYKTNLLNTMNAGYVTHKDVDRAVKRVYKAMFRLGMLDPMEDQYYVNKVGMEVVDSAASRATSLKAARESIVLVKNEGEILPLRKGQRVAFIGPHANSTQEFLSNYHGTNKLVDSNSPLMAARDQGWDVSYAEGVRICDYPYGKNPGFPNMPCNRAGNLSGVAEAVRVAGKAEVAVLFLGSDQTTEAENFDRSTIGLAGNGSQAELLRQVLAVQPAVIVVLVHGGPIFWDHTGVRGIVDAFYPGELGGPAIVDVLSGAYNPGGKMPVTTYSDTLLQRD
eukprot:Hpha_TRINITY_DN15896_c2_g1::TRINITY_DN15896_c2_g1_i1::g.191891::m.191891